MKILIFCGKDLLKQLKMKQKKKREIFRNLLVASGASALGRMLTGKGMLKAGYENKEGKGMFRAGYGSSIFIPPHPLTNFKIKKYYQNESSFSRVDSRGNLPKNNKGWHICNKL